MKNPKIDGLACTPVFIASAVVNKFDDHLPLYRQSEMFARQGLLLSRQRLSFWFMRYGTELLPFWQYLKRELYWMHLINQDETTVEVLDARTKNNEIRKDSFIFIRTGSTYIALERTTHVIVLFEYIQGCSTSVLMDDYRRLGHEGYVMSDEFRQYENIPDEVHAVCWVHAERAIQEDSQEKSQA